jgi:hypothetical protein
MTREQIRERFRRLGAYLDDDDRERMVEAAGRDPGEKIASSAQLSEELLAGYHRLLLDPRYAAAEDERAWRQADLHQRWRERRRGA